jgi:hypothetical protein
MGSRKAVMNKLKSKVVWEDVDSDGYRRRVVTILVPKSLGNSNPPW